MNINVQTIAAQLQQTHSIEFSLTELKDLEQVEARVLGLRDQVWLDLAVNILANEIGCKMLSDKAELQELLDRHSDCAILGSVECESFWIYLMQQQQTL